LQFLHAIIVSVQTVRGVIST